MRAVRRVVAGLLAVASGPAVACWAWWDGHVSWVELGLGVQLLAGLGLVAFLLPMEVER